jgi:hypothetical protein
VVASIVVEEGPGTECVREPFRCEAGREAVAAVDFVPCIEHIPDNAAVEEGELLE